MRLGGRERQASPLDNLTPREGDMLALVAEGPPTPDSTETRCHRGSGRAARDKHLRQAGTPPVHRKSVSSRKVYVEEYSAGARPGYGRKCFVTVVGLFDELETACGEQFSRRAELLVVVNNQDPVGRLTHSW